MDGAFYGSPEVEEGQGFSGFTCALSKVYACHSHLSAAEKTLCKNSSFLFAMEIERVSRQEYHRQGFALA